MLLSTRYSLLKIPLNPCEKPTTSSWCWDAVNTRARIAAFMPGASPPEVKMPILFMFSAHIKPW